jgi:uncharacterized protein with GYD domain
MATYYLFGKYTQQALNQISADRTKKAKELIAKLGGKLQAAHALLGDKDLVLVVELPGIKEALKLSIALMKLSGIGFSTCEAIAVDELDKLAKEA